ncbi:MAG: CoA-binding protein [archaeon GW2011_AR20]|nr:MAG: CoA-binding protein [archaeon GW2011_AR20]MBS3160934.1 CoA-binding protein [Candidatus Woesearchaeota archaeon]
MDLNKFFKAKSIAIIGISKNPNKIGHLIFRNLVESNFQGNLFLVNPNAYQVLNKKVYKNVNDIEQEIELAIITVPAKIVPGVIKDCGKKKIQNVVIITSGFRESGNEKLEDEVKLLLGKFKIKCIGVNALGVYDAYSRLDSLFIPRYRMKRPKQGGISFISQSASMGLAIIDLATTQSYGISKFISYGNATNIDESDILEYLGEDKETKIICVYLQGIKDGQKFIKVAKKVSKLKPVIIVKGGINPEVEKTTFSHTGHLAGSYEVYLAAFKQSNLIYTDSLHEMFNFARILEKTTPSKGNRIQIITNGGGYGISALDNIIKNNLRIAELDKKTFSSLKKQLHDLATINNLIDLSSNATSNDYKIAIESCLNDNNVDVLLLMILYQIPLIDSSILDIITDFNNQKKKPIIVVSTGGEFTDDLRKSLEEKNVITFNYPEEAVSSIKALVDYYSKK